MRAVVVGIVAFQTYGPLLGVRFENAAGQIGDLDLAQFHSGSISVDDEIDGDLLWKLKTVEPRFEAILSPSMAPGRCVMRSASVVRSNLPSICLPAAWTGPRRADQPTGAARRCPAAPLSRFPDLWRDQCCCASRYRCADQRARSGALCDPQADRVAAADRVSAKPDQGAQVSGAGAGADLVAARRSPVRVAERLERDARARSEVGGKAPAKRTPAWSGTG